MHVGQYISGAGHLTLIGWLLLGGVFRSDPPPFEVTEVAVITGADFAALMAAQQSPDSVTEVAQPALPELVADIPDITVPADQAIETPAPAPSDPPPRDAPPQVTELSLPPETFVSDEAPVLEEPVGDVAVLVPELAPEAVPRPVERVAPEPVSLPEPDATPDPVEQTAVAPQETGETPEDPQEAQAPQEATTEIVTEVTTAPKASRRPPGRRPAAPAEQPAPNPTPAEANEEDSTAAAIAAAIAAANAAAQTPSAATPSGPPLSSGEKENLRVAVSNCWNVDVGGRSANTVVTVAVSLAPNGKVAGTVRLISSEGGDDAAVRTAFGAARRAILRCQKDGYSLPAEKYAHWKEIEMTFNPEKMRVR